MLMKRKSRFWFSGIGLVLLLLTGFSMSQFLDPPPPSVRFVVLDQLPILGGLEVTAFVTNSASFPFLGPSIDVDYIEIEYYNGDRWINQDDLPIPPESGYVCYLSRASVRFPSTPIWTTRRVPWDSTHIRIKASGSPVTIQTRMRRWLDGYPQVWKSFFGPSLDKLLPYKSPYESPKLEVTTEALNIGAPRTSLLGTAEINSERLSALDVR
jgi:hypothetical protein